MPVEEALEWLRSLNRSGELNTWIRMDARSPRYVDIPDRVDESVRSALAGKGIEKLYSHQAESYERIGAGDHVVVVTPTASGKTLCYNLPILDEMAKDLEVRALYLFPTKALAQDQMAELQSFIGKIGSFFGVHTYDGDTPADIRRTIRRQGRIVLTNPDMLHTALLPHHPKWIALFQNLKYVVVDELHTYRGVFGSHVANVFRRLKRIARFYNRELQFICTSATIANPAELASNLLDEEVSLISENGAPRGKKDLIFYNPPIVNKELGLRRSAQAVARRIAEKLLREKVQTLIFAGSRVNVEVLLKYLQNALKRHPAHRAPVRGYRGGYLPETRRQIERQLRDKQILGVVSTNALELGIDIGSLEACILAGYPGTVASTWQQIGRSGRRTGSSIAVLVARNSPLDQFIVNHPEYFLQRSPEHGLIHPDNLQILVSHIKCAAFELPFQEGEEFGKEELIEILEFLEEKGVLCKSGQAWHWSEESYPANSISLRSSSEDNFTVLDASRSNRVIAEVDFDSAPELIHDDAIYICEGQQYHVDKLDYDGRRAYVRPVNVDYYTEAITYSGLRVLRSDATRRLKPSKVEHGEVHLTKYFPGFKKIKFYTSENVGYGKIHLPTHELHTTSYWVSTSETALEELGFSRNQIIEGFLGIAYAMQHVATLILMCDLRDVGRSVGDRSARWFARSDATGPGFYSPGSEGEALAPEMLASFDPTIFLYDNIPSGIGFSEKLFEQHEPLWRQTRELIEACGCEEGCPSCVGPARDPGQGVKKLALTLLGHLIPDKLQAAIH